MSFGRAASALRLQAILPAPESSFQTPLVHAAWVESHTGYRGAAGTGMRRKAAFGILKL